jgi:hypothetical protein
VWGASPTALRAWSLAGQPLLNIAGNFGGAQVFAAAGELRVAQGPAGASVVERIRLETGVRTPATYMGTFARWFVDGERFLTQTGSTFRVYDKDCNQLQIVTQPTLVIEPGGFGDHFWLDGALYQVSTGAQIALQVRDGSELVKPGLNTPFLGTGFGNGFVLHLGASEAFLARPLGFYDDTRLLLHSPGPPSLTGQRFASSPDGRWAAASDSGVVFDDAALTRGAPLSCGSVSAIAGSSGGQAAIGLSSARVLLATIGSAAPPSSLDRVSTHLELSADGHRLAVTSPGVPQLQVLTVPSGAPLTSWSGSALDALSISSAGGVVAYRMGGLGTVPTFQVENADTSAVIIPAAPAASVALSPGGHLVAEVDPMTPTTRIYRDGALVNAVDGVALVWIDDDHLLVNGYHSGPTGTRVFDAVRLCDAAGTVIGSPPLPELGRVLVVDASRIYSLSHNAIFVVATGAKVWTSLTSSPSREAGIAGSYVVYGSGREVIAEPY